MRGHQGIASLIVISIAALLAVSSCQNPASTTPTTSTDAQQAQDLVKSAIESMKSGDYETALSDFSKATTLDPANGQAVIGYSTLNIASVITDSTLVSTMKNNIGLTNYPSTIGAVIDPNTWMTESTDTSGNPITLPAMAVSGQTDYNEDGVISFSEWGMSLASYVATHNTGFDFIPQTLNTALGSRVDAAISAIKQSVSDSMSFTITWDMIYSTKPDSSQWPYDANGNPLPFVIGKAELLSLAAYLEEVRADLHLAMVYSLSLPLSQYWTDFGPGSDGTTNPTAKPFSTLLQLNSDASSQLQQAKTNFSAALSDMITAANGFISDRPGYSLSSDSSTTIFTGSGFSDFIRGVKIAKKAAEEVAGSIANNTMAIFPITDYSTFNPDTDWPTTVSPGSSFGFNYGVAFSTPLALVSTTGLFELASTGDPQFYSLDSSTGTFSQITPSTVINGGSTNFTYSKDSTVAFLKVTDSTFGGIISSNSYPTDDQSSVSGYELTDLQYTDANGNNFWDSGESISSATASRSATGVVDLSAIQGLSGQPEDLIGYYRANPPGTNPTVINNAFQYAVSGDESALDTAVASLNSGAGPAIDASGTVVLDDTGTAPHALYIAVPEFYAWLSVAADNTQATNPDGTSVYSQGSIYWYLMNHTLQH